MSHMTASCGESHDSATWLAAATCQRHVHDPGPHVAVEAKHIQRQATRKVQHRLHLLGPAQDLHSVCAIEADIKHTGACSCHRA
jgi:hypothetical protein